MNLANNLTISILKNIICRRITDFVPLALQAFICFFSLRGATHGQAMPVTPLRCDAEAEARVLVVRGAAAAASGAPGRPPAAFGRVKS